MHIRLYAICFLLSSMVFASNDTTQSIRQKYCKIFPCKQPLLPTILENETDDKTGDQNQEILDAIKDKNLNNASYFIDQYYPGDLFFSDEFAKNVQYTLEKSYSRQKKLTQDDINFARKVISKTPKDSL